MEREGSMLSSSSSSPSSLTTNLTTATATAAAAAALQQFGHQSIKYNTYNNNNNNIFIKPSQMPSVSAQKTTSKTTNPAKQKPDKHKQQQQQQQQQQQHQPEQLQQYSYYHRQQKQQQHRRHPDQNTKIISRKSQLKKYHLLSAQRQQHKQQQQQQQQQQHFEFDKQNGVEEAAWWPLKRAFFEPQRKTFKLSTRARRDLEEEEEEEVEGESESETVAETETETAESRSSSRSNEHPSSVRKKHSMIFHAGNDASKKAYKSSNSEQKKELSSVSSSALKSIEKHKSLHAKAALATTNDGQGRGDGDADADGDAQADGVGHKDPSSESYFSKSSAAAATDVKASEALQTEAAADGIVFSSQDISGSFEDLLASQMPSPEELSLLPTSPTNESFDDNIAAAAASATAAAFNDTQRYLHRQLIHISEAAKNVTSTAPAMAAAVPSTSQASTAVIIPLPPSPSPRPSPPRTHEPIIIIDDAEEFDSGTDRLGEDKNEDYMHDEPRVLALRPLLPNPYDDVHSEEMSVVYAEQHTEIRLMCEVDLDIATSVWYKNGLVVHAMDRTSRVTDYRFIKETNGGLTITNVMLEDDGKWQCEAENIHAYVENARPVKLVVLDRPKPPYLLIDSRRLDAGNIFVPVKENSELNLACISEGGNPKPTLTWEVLLSPGVDRHAQKVSAEVLELEEVKSDNKDKQPYKINGGAKSEARLPAVYRAHHNARILCVMEHPTLKIRQNASLLLDVQYTPSFAISRTPGFGYPLREGIEVSLKCDVDSNPPSTPRWQKDDGDTPVPQTGDGFLNFTSIRREHSGWYKCTSRHLNFQYSSIGYYLSVRYDSVDVTSEPDDQDISVAAASHNPSKGQLEVQLGGAVTLQCPQGSLGCWSHLDPVTARLRGLGHGLSTPSGQFSLKDVVYQDAGTYKCIGQSPTNKKKLEVLQTVGVAVKGAPTVLARNATPVAYPGSPLHLSVEFCANPPAHAARWLHGDRVFTPGNQYGSTVLAYGVTDLPTPFCKEARLTYVSMHERVPRTFYFIVSSPGGVAEAVFKVNFTMRYRTMSNTIDDAEEELSEPEEIHFPVFGSSGSRPSKWFACQLNACWLLQAVLLQVLMSMLMQLTVMVANSAEL